MKTHLDCRQDGLLYLFRIKSDILLQFCFLFLLLFVCFLFLVFFKKCKRFSVWNVATQLFCLYCKCDCYSVSNSIFLLHSFLLLLICLFCIVSIFFIYYFQFQRSFSFLFFPSRSRSFLQSPQNCLDLHTTSIPSIGCT